MVTNRNRKSFGMCRKNSKSCSDDWRRCFWSAFRHFGTHFTESFHMSKSSWMMDPTHSREMPSCSAIDLSEILRSSKISSWIWSIISGVVGLRTYQRPGVYNYGMVYCTCIGIESPVGRKVYYILSTARCRLPEDKPSGSKHVADIAKIKKLV